MSVISQIVNGNNLNRDAGFSSLVSSLLREGVRSGFANELAITANQCDTGMAYVECTRTSVTPNEVFIVPVLVDTAEVIDTSGNGYIVIELDQTKINDGSANNADGTGIATVKKVAVLPTSNYIELASLASGVITDTRTYSGANNIVVENEETLKALSSTDVKTAILKLMTTSGYPEWQIIPRLEGTLTITQAKQLITKEYFEANFPAIAVESKTEAASSAREIFQNTDDGDRMTWEDSGSTQHDIVHDLKTGFIEKNVSGALANSNQDTAITTVGEARIIEMEVALHDGGGFGGFGKIIYNKSTHQFTYHCFGAAATNVTFRGLADTSGSSINAINLQSTQYGWVFGSGGNDQTIYIEVVSVTTTGFTIRVRNVKSGSGGGNSNIRIGYKTIV